MHDLQLMVVDGYRFRDCELDLSTLDAWSLALDQRTFGRQQLVVVTARLDGGVLGLAHCGLTDPPELALVWCLETLDDGAAAAIAYSDEPVAPDPPPGLEERFVTARVAAGEHGVHLVDWMLCDDGQIRSMRLTLEGCDEWWDLPPGLGLGDWSPPDRSTARPHRRRGGPSDRPPRC